MITRVKAYIKGLSEHPGIGYATGYTLIGAIVGLQKDASLGSALRGALIMSVFWVPVLLTVRREP